MCSVESTTKAGGSNIYGSKSLLPGAADGDIVGYVLMIVQKVQSGSRSRCGISVWLVGCSGTDAGGSMCEGSPRGGG